MGVAANHLFPDTRHAGNLTAPRPLALVSAPDKATHDMTEPNLLIICATAFVAVILLLSILAATIRLLTAIFPVTDGADAALVAAITAAHAHAFPGRTIQNIEEKP